VIGKNGLGHYIDHRARTAWPSLCFFAIDSNHR